MMLNNFISSLTGEICSTPKIIHIPDECISFKIAVIRNSGYRDIVEVITRDTFQCFSEGDAVRVVGFLYTYKNTEADYPKLCVCIYATSIVRITYPTNKNVIVCRGTVVHIPKLRKTPSGTLICDVLLAVNNELGDHVSASYIPTVCWNDTAKQMSALWVGTPIYAIGKLQSRDYTKTFGDGTTRKYTTREFSINTFSVLSPDEEGTL